MNKTLLITDFDGVLCDSIRECLLSSYNAYRKIHASPDMRRCELSKIDAATQATFRSLRPYIRSGEDFVLIQDMIEKQIPIASQEEFDRLKSMQSQAILSAYKRAFYAERDFLLEHEKNLWLTLNPLFDGIADALQRNNAFEHIHILTTKRKNDVREIMRYYGLDVPETHITDVPLSEKRAYLLRLLQENRVAAEHSVYIEDQVAFLIEAQQYHIRSYLVNWSYVSEAQKASARQHDIPIIGIEDFDRILHEQIGTD